MITTRNICSSLFYSATGVVMLSTNSKQVISLVFHIGLRYPKYSGKLQLIMIAIQPSMQQTLLITLHISALMGHLQVFPFIHYQLTELQRELHTFSLTYIGHIRPHSFSLPPYLGILTSVGLLYLSVSKFKLLFNFWLI
jgi:hypothetical protein